MVWGGRRWGKWVGGRGGEATLAQNTSSEKDDAGVLSGTCPLVPPVCRAEVFLVSVLVK